ncbi:MAG: class I SAM-dependent methyltransferase [Ruminococcus sp.]|nr:class I SAM-dependent methyltransferase [Ruminococcus sp.]
MSKTENYLQNVKNQGGIKGSLKRLLFRGIFAGFETVDQDVKDCHAEIDDCHRRIEEMENMLSIFAENNTKLLSEASKTADGLEGAEKRLDSRIDTIANAHGELSTLTNALHENFTSLSVNVRNSNSILERLSSDTEMSKVKLREIEREMKKISAAPVSAAAETAQLSETEKPDTDSDYEAIDYFDFENHFRGSIESIKNAQKSYLKYFENKSHVLDIGCGRGEFLSLLKENNINAEGVDIYAPYADYCQMQGLAAVCCDGTEYLASLDGVDGIFVGQVVEHLRPNEIIRLCNTAYERLTEGGCIVIETPNPTSLAIYTNAFYIDPSHVKPVHPLTMKYYLECAGFKNIEKIYTESSKPPYSIPELKCSSAENGEEFNRAMKTVSDIIFGSQDYAIIAVK